MQAAIRLYNDTSSVKVYIDQLEDTSLLVVSGQHWYKPSECQCEISVLLDSKPLLVKEIKINADGSFSFYLPRFSQIMQHTLTIKQYKDSNEIKEATLSFNVLPQERKLGSRSEKKDSS